MTDTVRAAGTLDLTVHRRDPAIQPSVRPASGAGSRYRTITYAHDGNALDKRPAPREFNGHVGATVCGRLLRLEELWVDYEPEPRDARCPRCFPTDADA